jgi:hypothetical protein
MYYLRFEEYSNRQELLSTATLKLRGVGSNPRKGNKLFLTLFRYLSDPLRKENGSISII